MYPNNLKGAFDYDQAYKPGSVVDSHLSSLHVAVQLKPPWGHCGRAGHPRSGVASDRVCRAA